MDDVLRNAIKFNCNVSDAQFWGYFSVCGLLMRYRDLFRSEQGLKPWSNIRHEEIAAWIAHKESQWPDLEHKGFRTLSIGERTYDPFEVAEINSTVNELGFIYGAGYGMYMKPTFYLAELHSIKKISGLAVYTSKKEFVRDLFTSPGMLQGTSIFLRLEPLMALLHYKYSELNARRVTALEDAFARYGFRHRQIVDDTFTKRMEETAERYAEVLLYHELAEYREEIPEWKDILSLAGDRKTEHYLRAVKDLIADTSEHGAYKMIIDRRDRGALSLTIALMEGYRRVFYPEIKAAYEEFSRHEDWSAIEESRKAGYKKFRSRRDAIVKLYRDGKGKEDFNRKISELLQTR